jgi:hypothetical protein
LQLVVCWVRAVIVAKLRDVKLYDLWVSAFQFRIDVRGQILESLHREGSEFLAGLVAFGMKIVLDGQEGHFKMNVTGKLEI